MEKIENTITSLQAGEVLEVLKTSPSGLTRNEAKRRFGEYGPNTLIKSKNISFFKKIFKHLKDLFSILLIFASILSVIGGMFQLGIVILFVVIINILFSLFQEWRAEKIMETLKNWVPDYTKVFRDGKLQKILVNDLVPGDIIVLNEGDRVPADVRIIEAYDLWVNNIPLTGESEPQPRTSIPESEVKKIEIDSPNLAFMSTSIAKGQAKAVVYTTGMNTKFGQIANLTQKTSSEQSPLQKEIIYMAKYDFILAISLGSIFLLVTLFWLRLELFAAILFFIGVATACVPEGLQITVSSALVISVLKMAKKNVLVKRLSAVQTLGSVTTICTDKTGTITKGEMTVRKIWVNDKVIEVSDARFRSIKDFVYDNKELQQGDIENLDKIIEISALCNTAKLDHPSYNHGLNIIGDPIDGALLITALKYGLNIDTLHAQKSLLHIIPFDSERKRMTTIHRFNNENLVYSKGAPRSILSICNKIAINGAFVDLKPKLNSIESKILEFARKGLRVIAISYKEIPKDESFENGNAEANMILLGLIAMKDPPRPEVKEAVRIAKQAGIKIVLITGDYGPTAQAIAEEVNIVKAGDSRIIKGDDLESLKDEVIIDEVKKEDVIFSRVSPPQKLRIVEVLKKHGEIVAVTGDGSNDAPSLKKADIGIAMGIIGTDVAKEAADIVLLDDNFASIVKAVQSGRTIYENIRRFITYIFSHNFAELIPFILYILLGIPLPLLVVQILAIDLFIDIVPSLALSREPSDPQIMKEFPRSVKERLFNTKELLHSLYVGIIIAFFTMIGCVGAWTAGGWHLGMQMASNDLAYIKGTTITFAGIVMGQAGNLISSKSNKISIFKMNLLINKWIWVSIITQVSILSFLIYLPFMQGLFGTTSLGFSDWLYLVAITFIIILSEELRKLIMRKWELRKKTTNSILPN